MEIFSYASQLQTTLGEQTYVYCGKIKGIITGVTMGDVQRTIQNDFKWKWILSGLAINMFIDIA